MKVLKVTLVVQTDEVVEHLAQMLLAHPGVESVSTSLPAEQAETRPSRIPTPYGPRFSIEAGCFFAESADGRLRLELSGHAFSMLALFCASRRIYFGARELHDALAIHQPELWGRRATATLRGDYMRLARPAAALGWPLCSDRAVYGLQALAPSL